jgi:hypothetical protein
MVGPSPAPSALPRPSAAADRVAAAVRALQHALQNPTGTPVGEPPYGRRRDATATRVGSVYSTVTLLARLRGWSTSAPRNTAVW